MNLLSSARASALLAAAAGAIACVACSSQAPSDYEGEALATVSGTVVNPSNATLPPMDAALTWAEFHQELADGGDVLENAPGIVASRVAVSSSFPSNFTLSVFTPPPDGKLVSCNGTTHEGPRVAVGFIVGLRRGADPMNVAPTDILAVSDATMVVYADSDIPEDADCWSVVSPALKKGYNLIGPAGFEIPFSSSRITLTSLSIVSE